MRQTRQSGSMRGVWKQGPRYGCSDTARRKGRKRIRRTYSSLRHTPTLPNASALVGMAAAASVRAAVDTTAILPNFSIMTRLPLFICLPTETPNKAPVGISRPLSRDISRYGKSEDRWVTRKHFCFGSTVDLSLVESGLRGDLQSGRFPRATAPRGAIPCAFDI